MPPRWFKQDNNARALDERAEAHGVSIWRSERPFDRIWGLAGVTALVEYKNPATPYGRAGLNPTQRSIAETWRGLLITVRTVDEVDAAVARLRALGRVARAV
jgi:hypothetical protein